MKLPSDLIQKMQGDYVAAKYKDGIPSFINVDEETLGLMISSFLAWAEKNEYINENSLLDISEIKDW